MSESVVLRASKARQRLLNVIVELEYQEACVLAVGLQPLADSLAYSVTEIKACEEEMRVAFNEVLDEKFRQSQESSANILRALMFTKPDGTSS